MLAKWEAERRPRKRTLMDFKATVRDFGAANTDPVLTMPIASITKSHCVIFKDAMVIDGKRTSVTINKRLSFLLTLFNFAIDNDAITINPASRVAVAVKVGDRTRRQTFSREDLTKIFTSPVFGEGLRPLAGCGEASFWVPVLAYATGARLEEIGQLQTADVHQADKRDGGFYFLDLKEDQGHGQKLKTESSRRRVPLHQAVIDLGFLDYVDSQREAKAAFLFPAMKLDQQGQRTGMWSKWFSRYLRGTIGIEAKNKVLHCFRHTFKDLLRDQSIPKDMNDRITGHTDGDVGSQYGEGHSLTVLNEAIQKADLWALRDLLRPKSSGHSIGQRCE